jgi:O-antigen/teichoic acid export membrane protein
MRRTYLGLTQVSAALMCPVLIGLGLVAPEAIPLIFGDKWRACVGLVQILSLVALAAPVNYYFSAAMVALGHSRLVLRQGVLQLVLGLGLAAAAAQISLSAVLIANVVRATVVAVANILDVRRRMELSLADLWRSMAPPYVSTAAMTVGVIATRSLLAAAGPLDRLAILSGVGGGIYVVCFWLGGRIGLWPAKTSMIEAMTRRRRRRPAAGPG